MKKGLIFIFALIVFVSFVSAAFPAPQDKYMNDYASVLPSEDSSYLRGLFAQVENETTAEVVFVSLDTINGEDMNQYATGLGQEWKVGKADKDNGMVILYVKDIGKIYVAVGYGLEGILPDSKIGRLLDENYVPYRDSGNLSEGIVQFSIVVANVMADNAEEIKSGQTAGNKDKLAPIYSIIIWIIVFIIISSIINAIRNGSKGKKRSDIPWWLLLFIPHGGRSSGYSGGGSGFGGGGFGGGGFGGGGAGR